MKMTFLWSEKFWLWVFRIVPPVVTAIISLIIAYVVLWGDSRWVKNDTLNQRIDSRVKETVQGDLRDFTEAINTLTKAIEDHVDSDVHMTYANRVKEFTTRHEFESLCVDFRDAIIEMRRINARIDTIFGTQSSRPP